jgi:hypothetical protein
MDGNTLNFQLRQILNESSGATWLDTRTSYDYLYQAAIATAFKIKSPTTTQDITTVASQTNYALNADFLRMYLTDDQNRYYIKYYDGTSYYWLYWREYGAIVLGNRTTAVKIPDSFTIRDASALTVATGTATSAGTATNNECTLTDTAATFVTSKIEAGDWIHNTTDGAHGVVISVTDQTHLVCAIYGGTTNDWSAGGTDSYKITPQPRLELVFDPAPSTASHTVTVYYVQKPDPVYSDYRSYKLNPSLTPALVNYAAWLYKYRDRQPDYGDMFYKTWDMAVRNMNTILDQSLNRGGYKVNFIKRASRSWSTR